MIIANLVGGLGNQMFQYACGRAVSLRAGQDLRLAADQFGEYHQHNGLELIKIFNLNVPIATKRELASLLGWQAGPKMRRLLGRPNMPFLKTKGWCNEPSFDYWPGIKKIKCSSYIHGYWQSELYFDDVADIIRSDLRFCTDWEKRDFEIRERMAAAPSVSLHIRRGDYLKGKYKNLYAQCDASYYVAAVELLRKSIPKINLFAFSDEPEWVEVYLKPLLGKIEIVSHNTGVRSSNDMRLMSSANHHIIANSSFSWWAAWLNPNKEKIVIAPKKWFADGRKTPTLLPASWLKI